MNIPTLKDVPIKSPTAIAFLVFDGVEERDFIGPWEIFGLWKREGRNSGHSEILTLLFSLGRQ